MPMRSVSIVVAMVCAHAGPAAAQSFRFEPLPSSTACTAGGAGVFPFEQPFVLPAGFQQAIVAREGDGGSTDNWDMNTLNETGPHAGRFLYRSHETPAAGQISVTDLHTGLTSVLVARPDWNRMDGIVWTPWHTLLTAEEMRPERLPSTPDPLVPQAQAGLLYEVDPASGATIPRPALGAKAHEGIRIDPAGNVYGISETAPTTRVGTPPRPAPGGYIFKFVPDRRGDLSSGQLYALKIVAATGDRTGDAIWIPLDRAAVQIDADAEATRAGATGYGRPEDVELSTSTGNARGGSHILFVAVTDEHRVSGSIFMNLRVAPITARRLSRNMSGAASTRPPTSTTPTTWRSTRTAISTSRKTRRRHRAWISGWRSQAAAARERRSRR